MGLLIVGLCILAFLLFVGYDYNMRKLLQVQKQVILDQNDVIVEQQILLEKARR